MLRVRRRHIFKHCAGVSTPGRRSSMGVQSIGASNPPPPPLVCLSVFGSTVRTKLKAPVSGGGGGSGQGAGLRAAPLTPSNSPDSWQVFTHPMCNQPDM